MMTIAVTQSGRIVCLLASAEFSSSAPFFPKWGGRGSTEEEEETSKCPKMVEG